MNSLWDIRIFLGLVPKKSPYTKLIRLSIKEDLPKRLSSVSSTSVSPLVGEPIKIRRIFVKFCILEFFFTKICRKVRNYAAKRTDKNRHSKLTPVRIFISPWLFFILVREFCLREANSEAYERVEHRALRIIDCKRRVSTCMGYRLLELPFKIYRWSILNFLLKY